MRMQSLMNEISALIRRDMRDVISLSDMGEHKWKASTCKSGREPSPEIELDLDLKLPSLQNCEKMHFCCPNHPAYDILL